MSSPYDKFQFLKGKKKNQFLLCDEDNNTLGWIQTELKASFIL